MKTTETINGTQYTIEWETTGEKWEMGWESLVGWDNSGNEFEAFGIIVQGSLHELQDVEITKTALDCHFGNVLKQLKSL